MTIFVACWSPYQLIHIWYFVDRESAYRVNLLFQEVLFIFGVSSCVVDPYVYGLYSMGIWNEIEFSATLTSCTKFKYGTSCRDARRGSFTADVRNRQLEALKLSRGRPALSGSISDVGRPALRPYGWTGVNLVQSRTTREDLIRNDAERNSVLTFGTGVISFSNHDNFQWFVFWIRWSHIRCNMHMYIYIYSTLCWKS